MMYSAKPPKIVQWILIAMAVLTLLATQVPKIFGMITPQLLFGISSWGIKHGFIWQLLTFGFLHPAGTQLGFGLLFSLFFNLYILYFVSYSLVVTRGIKDYCKLFFGGMITTGLSLFLTLWLTNAPFIYCSPQTAVFLLLTTWMMLDPERQILLFMTIPLKIKWLAVIFFGGQILIEFANGDFLSFIAHLVPCLFGWMFALLKWEIMSPFAVLNRFERSLLRLKEKLKRKNYDDVVDAKVYDFQTGKAILDDESFMDACLSKISKYGKRSLSFTERFRMRRISKRRQRGL